MEPTITGHAAVFDRETDIGGMFREVIRPGAFSAALCAATMSGHSSTTIRISCWAAREPGRCA